MNNKAQFTPLKKAVHVIPMLYAEAFAGSNNKEFVVELYEDARLLETAAPAMYEALQFVREFYQTHFDVMPVAFQTVDNICTTALSQAEGRQA